MTARPRARVLACAAVAMLPLAGCGGRGTHRPPQHSASVSVAAGTRSWSTTATPSMTSAPGPVAVARAFTTEICPYSYTDSRPYGQRLNTALERWGTTRFVTAHRWPADRIATAAAGLAEHQAQQVCGQMTGGLDSEATGPGGPVPARLQVVRLSVTVTAHSSTGPASTAQQVFTFQLLRRGARWLIDNGQW